MKLHAIDAGNFKLDGGAMFGVVPKTLWEKKIPADGLNLCNWKMRCLLVEDGKRLTLIDTGMGNKQSEKWQSYYFRNGEGDLQKSIQKAGFSIDDITDVILSHLHFDHAGGAILKDENMGGYTLAFASARYWTHSEHWQWAMNPNNREAATFLTENLVPIQESGNLFFIDQASSALPENMSLLLADGHTEKMIMPLISIANQKVLFVADTVPSHAHVHIPWVMGYDIRPLATMNEKEKLLQQASDEGWILFFDHDPLYECAQIKQTEKGFIPVGLSSLNNYL